MRRSSHLVLPVLLLLLHLASCAVPKGPSLDERIEAAMRPYHELAAQKSELWYLGQQPQEFGFPGQGTVRVRRWELSGWPGEEYVTARITYENTTDHVVDTAFVWLEILDANDEVAGSGVARLINPFGFALWPGHTITREIKAPTNGAHLDRDHWQWTIACETIQDHEPGEEPVLITRRNPYARSRYTPRYYYSASSTYCPPSYPTAVPGRNIYD